jgi:hypothetical protein
MRRNGELVGRVIKRIEQSLVKESDPRKRDDDGIAKLTMRYASEGHSDPWRFAFWMQFGLVPEKLVPFFVARDTADRTEGFPESLLPLRYNRYWLETFESGLALAAIPKLQLPPKKSPHSVPYAPRFIRRNNAA